MMGTRASLDDRLKEILSEHNVDIGEGHLYYQSPGAHAMVYPALVYKRTSIETRNADNLAYLRYTYYQLTWISRSPDDPMIDILLDSFESISYVNEFTSQGLYHTVFRLCW